MCKAGLKTIKQKCGSMIVLLLTISANVMYHFLPVVFSAVLCILGGKTPDSNMRRYQDVMMETRLKNEEV